MTFNFGSPPVALNGSAMLTNGGSSVSVSDSSGNLLFYTNGIWGLWNRNNAMMPNGNGLIGGLNARQPVLSVPIPGNPNQYYLFTVDMVWGPVLPLPFSYSVIDMTLDGGLGDIVPGIKNIPIPSSDSCVDQLIAVRHKNNRDIWVLVRRHSLQAKYLAYLVTPSGISSSPVISSSKLPCRFFWNSGVHWLAQGGDLKISQDGTKLVCCDSLAELCDFNSATGVVSPLFTFNTLEGRGAEFSVDSRCLYLCNVSTPTSSGFQYDLSYKDSLSFVQHQTFLGYDIGFKLQLAPDWKIYTGNDNWWADSLNCINNPNLPGLACNFQKNMISLAGHPNGETLPQFLQRYKAYFQITGICHPETTYFTSDIWPPPDSIHWDFGEPASGAANFSNLPNPSHMYSNIGTYTVELFVRHIDNRTDTTWKTFTIYFTPEPNLGADQTICIGDSVTFDAGACTGCTYLWKDLGSGLTVGTSQTFRTGQSGIYAVTVTSPNNCTGRDTVQLTTTPVPSVTNNPLSKSICSLESTNIPLTSNVSGTIFHWTASLTSGNIIGFSADSGLVINQVLTNLLPTPGIVIYHIIPKVGSCAGTQVDYQVTVNQGYSVNVSISASANNICAGTSVTFTANPTNPGSTPVYQWKVNGVISGTNSTSFIYTPLNNDVVTCVLTSSLTICISNNPATSNGITMIVNPILLVSVSVTASQNPVCSGTTVTFTATPTNGGTTPLYQWKVNGNSVGPNNPLYSYSPSNGDVVYCDLNSNIACPLGNPATSNLITMIVNANLLAGVTINASSNPFCPGSSVTFTASPVNGGLTPSYQWKVNGANAGTNSSTFTYNPVDNDSVRCVMTSNLSCVTGNPASSTKIIMSGSLAPVVTFTSCFDTITAVNAKPIKLKGGIPLGGTYSGPGVNSLTGIFTPATAGVGTKTIIYTYTNSVLCSASKSISIHNLQSSIFSCGNQLTDIRDNKVYQTVQIGSQCWMAANLNYGAILASSQDQRDNCVAEKYCYNDIPINCTNNGGLYQWDELMQFDEIPADQGFCPPGWHIPTENEWNTLFANWTNNGFAGSPLKYSGYSGFNALLSGARHINKSWDFQGFATFFWSSTTLGNTNVWAYGMNDTDPSVSIYLASRVNAFNVRCLRD